MIPSSEQIQQVLDHLAAVAKRPPTFRAWALAARQLDTIQFKSEEEFKDARKKLAYAYQEAIDRKCTFHTITGKIN